MSKFLDNKYLSVFLGLLLASLIAGYAISNILLFFYIIIGILFSIKNIKFYFEKSFIFVILYMVWGICSLIWTSNLSATLHTITKQIPLILIPLFSAQYPKLERDDVIKILRIFSVCLILYFFCSLGYSIYRYNITHNFEVFFYHQLVSLFDNNAIYISVFSSFCLLGNINLVRKKTKLDILIILILSIFIILLSSKNIIAITILFQFLIITYSYKKEHNRKIIIYLALFSLISVFFISLDNPIKKRFLVEFSFNLQDVLTKDNFYTYVWTGFTLRLFQLKIGWEMLQNNDIGLLGLGLGNAQSLLTSYYEYYNLYEGFYSFNFHNQYLQTLIELGYIGLILLLLIIFYGLYFSFKRKNLLMVIFFFLMISLFLTESFFSRQKGILFFIFVYCIFFNLKNNRNLIK